MRRNRNAKIVATLGPASSDKDTVRRLFMAGVDVFRLNFSHGSADDHRARFSILRELEKLGWKLDLQLRGLAGAGLIASYDEEAIVTADENILNSSRSTDFMTPKTPTSRAFRDAVLELARKHSFARPFVNSGRLSTARYMIQVRPPAW